MSYRVITFKDIQRCIGESIRTGTATTDIRTIMPDTAKRILSELNGNNRKKRPKAIDKYANDMKAGDWKISEAISFNMDGYLENGQHRLEACIKSRVPLTTSILFGAEKNPSLDRPVVRTIADNGKLYTGMDYDNTYVSAINNLYRIAEGKSGTMSDTAHIKVYEKARPYTTELSENIPKQENHIKTDAALASALLVLYVLDYADIDTLCDMVHVFRDGIFSTESERKLRRLRDDKLGKRGAFDPRQTTRLANTTQNATKEYLKYFIQYLKQAPAKKSEKVITRIICEAYETLLSPA